MIEDAKSRRPHSACTASIFGLYFRVQLYRSPDLTWNLAPVLATL